MAAGSILGTIATYAAIASAAASVAAIGYQAAQSPPKTPNLASSSREVAEAQANALPDQRRLAAAAQQGGKTTYSTGPRTEKQLLPFVNMPSYRGARGGQLVPYDPKDWQEGGKYYDPSKPNFQPNIIERKVKVRIPAGTKEADFTGYGTADVEGDLARKMTDIQLDLGRKYGTQFADEARKAQEQADPEGTAARKLEMEMIQKELDKPSPINPLSASLDKSISGQVGAGSGLDDMSQELLDAALARASADRGGSGLEADLVDQSMSTGMEGQARREAALRKGSAWLASGSTPEDIAYRREQQNISNLGAFVAGQTPQSQFQNLAGAGRGAAPFVPGQAPPQLPQNAGAGGGQYAVNSYQAKINQAANQANPWLAGMSTLLNGISAAGNTVPTR